MTEDDDYEANAAVRDESYFSVEVIVLVKHKNGELGLLPWVKDQMNLCFAECPSDEESKVIAQQKVRLPAAMCQKWNVEKTIRFIESTDKCFGKWQESHWLRKELILMLDENLSCMVGEYRLSYSREYGLAYSKEE